MIFVDNLDRDHVHAGAQLGQAVDPLGIMHSFASIVIDPDMKVIPFAPRGDFIAEGIGLVGIQLAVIGRGENLMRWPVLSINSWNLLRSMELDIRFFQEVRVGLTMSKKLSYDFYI